MEFLVLGIRVFEAGVSYRYRSLMWRAYVPYGSLVRRIMFDCLVLGVPWGRSVLHYDRLAGGGLGRARGRWKWGVGFRVYELGFRVQGLGFRV